jgi:hypothetical protein
METHVALQVGFCVCDNLIEEPHSAGSSTSIDLPLCCVCLDVVGVMAFTANELVRAIPRSTGLGEVATRSSLSGRVPLQTN